MFPLMAFEALSLRSHAPYFLIEHINFALECASLDCFASSPRILFRVFSTESLWISAIMPASVEDETISDNICAPTFHKGIHFSAAVESRSGAEHTGLRIRENREGARVRRLSPRILRRPPVVAVVTFEFRRGAAPQAA